MPDLNNLTNVLSIIPTLYELSKDKGKNKDQFPVFNTKETNPEKFWNSLNKGEYYMLCGRKNYYSKTEVGKMALHQGFMTPNTRFDCSNTQYKDLKKIQQKIITETLKCKDEPYTIIAIRSLLGNLFKI